MTSTALLPRPPITNVTLPGAAFAVVLPAETLRAQLDAARLASTQLMLNRRVAGQGAKVTAAPRRMPLVVQRRPIAV